MSKCLAGCPSLIDDLRNDLLQAGILAAIEAHDTPKLFDWIVPAFSYQGIADAIAGNCAPACRWKSCERQPCSRWRGFWLPRNR
jgi:hypothetical protein